MDTTAGKHAGDRGDQAGRPASRIKIGHPWLPPLAITTLALALRIYQLGTESLWIDEGYSIEDARNLNFRLGVQDVRPLYNIILSLWLHLGESEFVLRLPAALLGATAVLAVYLLGRRIASEHAGLFAAGLMAVSPLHVNHSQEVRMYSLVTLLVLLAMYEFFLFLSARRTSHLAGCLVFTALSIATFPPAALLILVQNLAVLRGTPRWALRNWFIAQVLLLAPCIPLFLRTVEASKYLAPEAGTGPSALDAVRITGSFSLLASGPAGSMTWYAFSAYTFGSRAYCLRFRADAKAPRQPSPAVSYPADLAGHSSGFDGRACEDYRRAVASPIRDIHLAGIFPAPGTFNPYAAGRKAQIYGGSGDTDSAGRKARPVLPEAHSPRMA